MKLYLNNHTDPCFNLAAEEYLLTHADDDIIMLWRNEASVIIGKNQNAYAEINLDFTSASGIKVVRRLTGGGAVFHDLGNVNFTFISAEGGKLSEGIAEGGLDFAHFTRPIIAALCSLGVNAELSGRNDIIVRTPEGERKVSGNAQCVVDGVTMHHGTLLFAASLTRLQGALNVDSSKLKSKGIASVRSRVANIYDLLPEASCVRVGDVTAFMAYLSKYLSHEFALTPECLTPDMERGIETLMRGKYTRDEWNLQRFGNFGKPCRRRFDYGTIEASLTVADGYIVDVRFFGDFFGVRDVSPLGEMLRGVRYSRGEIMRRLAEIDTGEYIFGSTAEDICDILCDFDTVS